MEARRSHADVASLPQALQALPLCLKSSGGTLRRRDAEASRYLEECSGMEV